MLTIQQSAITNLKEAGLGDIIYTPGEQLYDERVKFAWSLTAQLKPWAFVQPRSTDEVSRTIKALVKTAGCKFAVRSGGHMSWPGANNIEDGITIDLGLMSGMSYDPETKIAALRPGGRWTDVYNEIEKHGAMIAGGREGAVGIAGLLVGGGKTFYTCRYGFACDQIVNYEVVLADGSIVNANKNTNSDLFQVLKGGSNNFGIVTRFDVVTFPAKDIWDGGVVLPRSAAGATITAFVDFVKTLHDEPNNHVLAMWVYMPKTEEHIIQLSLTNLDGVVGDRPLQKFLNIPDAQPRMKITSVAQKVESFLVPAGAHDTWFTLTFKNDARIAEKAANLFESMIQELRKPVPDGDFYSMMVLQPLPKTFAQRSLERGGNMFGLERLKDDCILLVIALEMGEAETMQAIGFAAIKKFIDEVESFARSVAGDVDFRYLNYCEGTQDPLKTYGEENVEKMKVAAKKYDPTGVFQTRVPGGFKISKVD